MYESQNTTRTSGNGIKTDTDKTATNKNALMKLKSYLIALRVWSLSASIIPTILGKSEKQETWTKNIVQQVPWHSPWRSQKKKHFSLAMRSEGSPSKLDLWPRQSPRM